MRVLKHFTDFDKEEKWLEDMGRKGLFLAKAGNGCYKFIRTDETGDTTIRIDYRNICNRKEFEYYCSLFEDSGWQHIAGTRWTGEQYFVKARPDAGDDIFSDHQSRAERYKRLSYLWLSMSVIFSGYLFTFAPGLLSGLGKIYKNSELFTMSGWHFVCQFLFTSVLGLLSISPLLIYLGITVYYVYYTVKAYLSYRSKSAN